jgi:hypothetical protein
MTERKKDALDGITENSTDVIRVEKAMGATGGMPNAANTTIDESVADIKELRDFIGNHVSEDLSGYSGYYIVWFGDTSQEIPVEAAELMKDLPADMREMLEQAMFKGINTFAMCGGKWSPQVLEAFAKEASKFLERMTATMLNAHSEDKEATKHL